MGRSTFIGFVTHWFCYPHMDSCNASCSGSYNLRDICAHPCNICNHHYHDCSYTYHARSYIYAMYDFEVVAYQV